uniref:NPH3 domain-containing protein n=1 Tax=Macrostomum lignano TaxID=282301 RepID=A0A1I8FJC8_9PLAT
MDDEELRYGMRCRYLRDELVELPPGGRNDGLKHRNVTCAFIVRSDGDPGETLQPDGVGGASFSGILSGILVCALLRRLLRLHADCAPAAQRRRRSRPSALPEFCVWATSRQGRRRRSWLKFACSSTSKAAAPSFLQVPRVPTFQWTLLNDEEKQMVEVNCSDGALCAERSLLMRRVLSVEEPIVQLGLKTRWTAASSAQSDMKVFLFYLQTQLFFDLARFDTFNSMAQIAVRYSVSGVVKRCAMFVNDCVLLAEAGNRQSAEPPAPPPRQRRQAAVASSPSKVRWTPDDLVAIWRTTVSYLGEDGLGKALMRLISQSSYSEIVNLSSSFQQLDALTKSQFYHQFLLCKESSRGNGDRRSSGCRPYFLETGPLARNFVLSYILYCFCLLF